ncbi:hypothetical protein HOH87_03500 [bacterium]|nr:hypothetical protein [bacterium]
MTKGVPLETALTHLIGNTEKVSQRKELQAMLKRIREGASLIDAVSLLLPKRWVFPYSADAGDWMNSVDWLVMIATEVEAFENRLEAIVKQLVYPVSLVIVSSLVWLLMMNGSGSVVQDMLANDPSRQVREVGVLKWIMIAMNPFIGGGILLIWGIGMVSWITVLLRHTRYDSGDVLTGLSVCLLNGMSLGRCLSVFRLDGLTRLQVQWQKSRDRMLSGWEMSKALADSGLIRHEEAQLLKVYEEAQMVGEGLRILGKESQSRSQAMCMQQIRWMQPISLGVTALILLSIIATYYAPMLVMIDRYVI